jgi:alkylation response protein AidB-like acyl-CoA dehydrogenase/broad specificity phosphatase PhoE
VEFEYSEKTRYTLSRLESFMDEHVYPNEQTYYRQLEGFGTDRWQIPPIVEELKEKARAAGLWNLFLPESERGAGFTNLEYAPLCEVMGRVGFAPEVFNCSAPDTGNMEVIERYGTDAQKARWLTPLLEGRIRSAFAMTEPAVASSDATNIQTSIRREGDEYVIDGRKWWTSGVVDPRCEIMILMGRTNPDAPTHKQQSMILVPRDTPGVTVERHLPVFGFDDAPHGHGQVLFENVRVPAENMLLGEGRGFEIAQGRLGPGRIHHCMRVIGVAERVLEKMCQRLMTREAFGKKIYEHSVWEERGEGAQHGASHHRSRHPGPRRCGRDGRLRSRQLLLGRAHAAPGRRARRGAPAQHRPDRVQAAGGASGPSRLNVLRIYLARHGQTDWNRDGRLQGSRDVSLNEKGLRQARRLRRRLAGLELDAVYASTLQRSLETARVAADGRPVAALAGLAEQDMGAFEGLRRDGSEPERQALYERRQHDPDDSLDGGESSNAHEARVRASLDELLERHASGAILIVGHSRTNKVILGVALGLDARAARALHPSKDDLYLIERPPRGAARVWHLVGTG